MPVEEEVPVAEETPAVEEAPTTEEDVPTEEVLPVEEVPPIEEAPAEMPVSQMFEITLTNLTDRCSTDESGQTLSHHAIFVSTPCWCIKLAEVGQPANAAHLSLLAEGGDTSGLDRTCKRLLGADVQIAMNADDDASVYDAGGNLRYGHRDS